MANISLSIDRSYFPFPVQLHLKPFIDQWRSAFSTQHTSGADASLRFIEETLRQHPFLLEPLEDPDVLKNYPEFLDHLFASLLPHQSLNNAMQAVGLPFNFQRVIVATEAFNKLVAGKEGLIEMQFLSTLKGLYDYRVLYGYKLILKKLYGLDFKVDQPVKVASGINRETGLNRYFKLVGSMQFIGVSNLAPLPYVDERILQKLLDRPFDTAEWTTLLPPEIFLFSGLSVITLVDITIEEAITRLQYNLLNHGDANDPHWFNELQQEMRNLFRLPGLRLGVATLQPNGELNFATKNPLWNSLLLREGVANPNILLKGSAYEEIITKGETVIIEDIRKQGSGINDGMQILLDAGYCNLLLTPLVYDEKMIGILELASPVPGEINGLSLFKVNQIKPIFANALKRQTEIFETKVEAVMLEKFTSIHPSIQWRFKEAAVKLLQGKTDNSDEEEIAFENVYPFYGSLDIRDSSKKRNKAIEQDLVFNLENALLILRQGYETLSFDILGELISDIEKRLVEIKTSFSTGDELTVTEFIRKEVNPVMLHLQKQYPHLFSSSEMFSEIVRSESGICNRNRLAYEEALLLVNRCIVNCLEEEEANLQRLYPCFFEKTRTDGVEYNIYMGSSLAPGLPFDPLYLDNLQLRQLLWTCKIVRKVEALQPQLQAVFEGPTSSNFTPGHKGTYTCNLIEIAPLILAYGSPVTLKFSIDEKRLEVDGAYNVRYELLKKRIDKAVIQGTGERLTKPGHIALVYAREQEATAYRRHINYLVNKEFIEPEFEQLNLEPLQAVEGLKAIRAKLKNNTV
ncbi:MAG: GAF domain-containing protein [Flavisolibacter sp.]|nr:GAF domain-containing protein [Flavisolibacter sp.]